MKTLLVLGSNGQDGKSISEIASNFKLNIVYVSRTTSRANTNHYTNHVFVDQLSSINYSQILYNVKPDYVLNLIGQSSVGKSFAQRDETYFANYLLAKMLIEQTMLNSDAHFLQASSAYIFDCSLPINFSSSIKAISPYAASKAQLFEEIRHDRVTFFHFFNHVSRYSSPNFVLPKIAMAFSKASEKVDLDLAGVGKSRDWGLSTDYMEVILNLCINDSKMLKREYFIGSGLQMRLNEVINIFSDITNKPYDLNVKPELQRAHDPELVIFDKDSCLNQGIVLPSYCKVQYCKDILSFFWKP